MLLSLGDGAEGGEGGGVREGGVGGGGVGGGVWGEELEQRHGWLEKDNEVISSAWKCSINKKRMRNI